MCGIAGIIGRIGQPNRAALERMQQALAHRGPDMAAVWVGKPDAAGNGCMLAHRRLSILDLSPAGNQPMTDPIGGQVLVFNGEIYNYAALREELIGSGQQFSSSGDTIVMLRLLATRGYRAVDRLRGMFAFGLWDEMKRELVLARDPLGIKPLYVAQNPDANGEWSLVFASEVRAILASGLPGKPQLNRDAVASVVWNGFVVGPSTAVRGVESLNPSELHVYDGAGRTRATEMYWSMKSAAGEKPVTEQELHDALRESVRLHLASDVPLGVFLSGGVDSAAMANLARQSSDDTINTFTLVFEEAALSEAAPARAAAEAIGTRHHEIMLTESMFAQNLDRAIDSLDQPTFDGLNSFYLSKVVREAGLTVALAGTGGDELFGGYTSFRDLPQMMSLSRMSGWVPRRAKVAAARAVAYAMAGRGGAVRPQTRWAKLPDMVRSGEELMDLYQLAYALFLPDFQRELLAGGLVNGSVVTGIPASMRDRVLREAAGRSPLAAVSVMEQRLFLGERLLRDTDAASMAVSLEVRLPLVDQVIVGMTHRLPDASRFRPVRRKELLRRIGLRGLDPALFERPKSGFVLPFDRWIRQRLGNEMDETMRDPRMAAAVGLSGEAVARLWRGFRDGQKGLYWSRVWALYVLMRWCHRHGVLL